jgi:hypothetical protein
LNKIIKIPPAKLESEPCKDKPIAKPAAPRTATKEDVSIPSLEITVTKSKMRSVQKMRFPIKVESVTSTLRFTIIFYAVLEMEKLNAVQWTPGYGQPQGGSPQWYDLYKRILASGKSIMANWVTLDELEPLIDNVGNQGLHINVDFKSEKDIETALRIVERYR